MLCWGYFSGGYKIQIYIVLRCVGALALSHVLATLTPRHLLTGSGECGKSTIVEQMKIIHQDGLTPAELATFKPTVYRNVRDSAQSVLAHMWKVGLECADYGNRQLTETIPDYKLSSSTNPYIAPSRSILFCRNFY